MRPRTLREVAAATAGEGAIDFPLRNFLDDFQESPSAKALADEPQRLAGRLPQGEVDDAYLAATAEMLARQHGLPVPAWARNPERTLARPWFALPWAGMRGILLVESPEPFRQRNLFVSANALSRA